MKFSSNDLEDDDDTTAVGRFEFIPAESIFLFGDFACINSNCWIMLC